MNNFIEIKNKDIVKISPSLLNSDYRNNILKILKKKYEGVCSKFGYIKRNSISIRSITRGVIEMSTFHGYVLFEIEFISNVCNPSIGSIVKCNVKNINAFGILCSSGIMVNNVYDNILNIVVPKNNGQFINNSSIMDNININDDVNVEILGKKYILNNKTINVFGKIIDGHVEKEVTMDNDNTTLELEDDDNDENVVSEEDDDDETKSEEDDVKSISEIVEDFQEDVPDDISENLSEEDSSFY